MCIEPFYVRVCRIDRVRYVNMELVLDKELHIVMAICNCFFYKRLTGCRCQSDYDIVIL